MTTHKDQHFVPRSYLAAWCDVDCPAEHEPYVWRVEKNGTGSRRKAPRNIFTEKDMYTLPGPDGKRELGLEHLLADLESEYVQIRDDVILHNRPLDDLQRVKLCTFMAAMQARSVQQRDHWKSQLGEVYAMGQRMKAQVQAMTPEQRRKIPPSTGGSGSSLSHDEVGRLADNPVPMLLSVGIAQFAPMFASMHLVILRTDEVPGFITSDAPCVIYDPQAYKRPFPYNAPGLAFPTAEVTMPVSPTHMAVLLHKSIDPAQPVPGEVVAELNRRTRAHADKHFIVSKDFVNPIWLEMGAPET